MTKTWFIKNGVCKSRLGCGRSKKDIIFFLLQTIVILSAFRNPLLADLYYLMHFCSRRPSWWWSLVFTLQSSSVVCAPGTVTIPPDQERRSSAATRLPGPDFNAPATSATYNLAFAFSSNLCLWELVGQLGVRSWLCALSYWRESAYRKAPHRHSGQAFCLLLWYKRWTANWWKSCHTWKHLKTHQTLVLKSVKETKKSPFSVIPAVILYNRRRLTNIQD